MNDTPRPPYIYQSIVSLRAGTVIHAIAESLEDFDPEINSPLCGARLKTPTSFPPRMPVTCKKCLRRLAEMPDARRARTPS